jgi:hypothetical protein
MILGWLACNVERILSGGGIGNALSFEGPFSAAPTKVAQASATAAIDTCFLKLFISQFLFQ